MSKCIKCGGPTEVFKCDICDAEAEVHVEDHSSSPSAEVLDSRYCSGNITAIKNLLALP